MPRIGQLRETVEIQASSRGQTDSGGQIETWALAHRCRARVEPLTGAERLEAEQLVAAQGYRVTIRRPPSIEIKATHRILWSGRVLTIAAVQNTDERGRFLAILADDQGFA